MKLTGRIGTEDPATIDKLHLSAQHMIMPRIWAVVIDGGKARVLKRNGRHLELIGEILPGHEMEATIGRGEGTRHHRNHPDVGNGSIAHRLSGYFAHQLAAWLEDISGQNAFDQLVIAAPPQMLGELRKALSPTVQEKIVMEINKDFVKHDIPALEKDFADIIWH